eukprot:237786_1
MADSWATWLLNSDSIEDLCILKQQTKRRIVVESYCHLLSFDLVDLCEKYCSDLLLFGWDEDTLDPCFTLNVFNHTLLLKTHNTVPHSAFGDWMMKPKNAYKITFRIIHCQYIHFGVCLSNVIHEYTTTDKMWHLNDDGASLVVNFVDVISSGCDEVSLIVDLKDKPSICLETNMKRSNQRQLKRNRNYVMAVLMFGELNEIQCLEFLIS